MVGGEAFQIMPLNYPQDDLHLLKLFMKETLLGRAFCNNTCEGESDGDGTVDCKETNSPDPSTTPAATPTPTATATPTFNLVSYKPPAPTVKKVAALTVDIKFSTSAVTDPSAVSSFDLTGRKLSASSNKIRARVGFRKKSFLGGRLKLPSSGRWSFSVRYNGSGTTQSLSSNESRAITVN